MLFWKIDERGMTDAQCYKKANIDAVGTAARYGITPERAVNYRADHKGTRVVYDTVSETMACVCSSAPIAAGWSAPIQQDHEAQR